MAGHPIHSMPMSEMPGMYVAGMGILLVVVGALLRGRTASSRPDGAGSATSRRLTALVATAALTIDISKTATLGFVIPGMRTEYGLPAATASMLAVAGLSGTATGALVAGRLVERVGRRNTYLIATLGFTATSLCGTMPTFAGNVVMCFLMGIAVGGLAPLLIAVLTDLFAPAVRGPIVAGLSVVATAVGYLVASGSALWLEPTFGWRVLWLIGAPTGLLLAMVTLLLPERSASAVAANVDRTPPRAPSSAFTVRLQWLYAGMVGLLTFGLTTWVPTLARESGLSTATSNRMLTVVSLVMVPCALVLALCYRKLGPVRLASTMGISTAVILLLLTASGLTSTYSWLAAAMLAAALFAVNSMASIFLPIASDLAQERHRSRTTGTVSFFNRLGGLTGPLVLSYFVSTGTDVLITVAVMALLCGAVAWYTGRRQQRSAIGTHPS
ncbi:MFS transporter [Saccharopolyspora sp. NPDC000359]|uniref:MFS transporter n=1 Tax=Saccharopolyspora sp. NPDC000359 TaxID=3154251 RepID=UPI00331C4A2F